MPVTTTLFVQQQFSPVIDSLKENHCATLLERNGLVMRMQQQQLCVFQWDQAM